MKVFYKLLGIEEFLEHLHLKVQYNYGNANVIKLVYIPAGTTNFNRLAEKNIPKSELNIYSNFEKSLYKDGSVDLDGDNNQGELLLEG